MLIPTKLAFTTFPADNCPRQSNLKPVWKCSSYFPRVEEVDISWIKIWQYSYCVVNVLESYILESEWIRIDKEEIQEENKSRVVDFAGLPYESKSQCVWIVFFDSAFIECRIRHKIQIC